MTAFSIIGLWVAVMMVTFIVLGIFALIMRDATIDFLEAFSVGLAIFVVLLELFLCSVYINFKTNPEYYGYTRIEQEIETEVIDRE